MVYVDINKQTTFAFISKIIRQCSKFDAHEIIKSAYDQMQLYDVEIYNSIVASVYLPIRYNIRIYKLLRKSSKLQMIYVDGNVN